MDCVVGLDFGTASVRGVLLDAASGDSIATHEFGYAAGLIEATLPNGRALPPSFSLQHAPDYVDAAQHVLERLGRGRRVLGVGIDCTASSPLPARRDGTPLSTLWPDEPHAYLKLWKHHAAQGQADRVNAAAPEFLRRYGGRTSSEWSLAKAIQLAEETPHLWAATERWIEAGDWIVWQLTGVESRSRCLAAYKAHYQDEQGYPAHVLPGYVQRLQCDTAPLPLGCAAGTLAGAWLARTGLIGPTVVATAVIDAHAVLPAAGVTKPGTLLGTLGTSACYLVLSEEAPDMPGISGSVHGGAVPDLWCHESGQPAFGDALAWFARAFPAGPEITASLAAHAAAAAARPAGADRLLALDWWNGSRCPLSDADLSGLMVGLTPDTAPAEIFRAIETSLCFGARQIHGNYVRHGIAIDRIVLTGGVAERSPSLLQRMADVFAAEIHVPRLANATAVGAAVHGAVAAGVCADFDSASRRFGARGFDTFRPDAANASRFAALYPLYLQLSANPALQQTMRALQSLSRASFSLCQ